MVYANATRYRMTTVATRPESKSKFLQAAFEAIRVACHAATSSSVEEVNDENIALLHPSEM